MSEINDGGMSLLNDIGRALKYAEKENAKARHGSTLPEYEQARRLGESFSSQIDGAFVKAVRDLPEDAGIELIIPFHGKDRSVKMSFDDIHAASNHDEDNEDLYADWLKQLKSSASIVEAPVTVVKSTAKRAGKTKAQ